jgi:hypothetical protein
MIIIGLLALLLAALQHRSAIQALKLSYLDREHYPAIRRSSARLLGMLIALLGLLAIVSALFRGRSWARGAISLFGAGVQS